MRNKEDLRIIKTKKSLYDGLLKLMKDNSFENITVSNICSVSLVNRSTFYDHFNDKYELLSSLIKNLESELANKLESNHSNYVSAKKYYMSMISVLFDHLEENISIYSSIIKNNNNSIANDMFRNTILKDVKIYIEETIGTNTNVPAEIISIFYVSAVINVCVEYVKDPKKYTKDRILKYLDNLVPDNIY